MTSARSITERAHPPRSVFVDLPLGHTSGLPGDRDGQREILSAAFETGLRITRPGSIEALPFRYVDDAWKAAPLAWSRKRQERGATQSSGGDSRTGRSASPVWQEPADRDAAETVSWEEQCQVCLGIDPAERA